MSAIDTTLSERGSRYGEFTGHALITQGLKDVMQASPKWARLANDQKEALAMTAHKIGRILNGDPDYIDSWHDIIGYVRLVEQRLERELKRREPVIGGLMGAIQAAGDSAAADPAAANQAQTKPAGQDPRQNGDSEVDKLARAERDIQKEQSRLAMQAFKQGLAEKQDQQGEKLRADKEPCYCPACSLERELKAAFGDGIQVVYLGEESGHP